MTISDDIARIALQEQELQFVSFDEETAWKLGSRIRALAIARNHGLVVDVRRFGQPLFYSALPGTTPDNVEWVRRKGNVVARFHRSSYAIGRELEEKKSNLLDRYGLRTDRLRQPRRQFSPPRRRCGVHWFRDRFRLAPARRSSVGRRSALRGAGPLL